jgi:predicted CopG family antitoxin
MVYLTQDVSHAKNLEVKTISLSDSAYQRLHSWKEGATFSEVIERMIPPKGTLLGAMAAAAALPEMPEEGFDEMESLLRAARQPLGQPWS